MKQLILSLMVAALGASQVLGADDASAARIADLEKKLDDLDQKYRVLERRLELDKEASSEKAKTTPSVSIGANGFSMRSADTNFVLKIRGLVQADSRFYVDDGGINNNDTFLLRRARPIIEGTVFDNYDFQLVPEFGGSGAPTILEANINARYSPALQLRVGKFKSPVGLEQLQSDSQAFFIERGLPTSLTPNRDIGIQLHGELFDGVAQYAAGVFNGVGDNRNSTNVDFDDEKEFAGRLFFHPFLKTSIEALQGLGLGLGGSYGNEEGDAALPNGNGFVTEGQQRFFTYISGTGTNANVIADGNHWRLSPQAYYYFGPFGLLTEYVISSQEIRRTAGTTRTFLRADNTSWQVAGSYVITGENASYKGVTPKKPFSIAEHQWGAFEVVARYSTLDIDNDVFPLFADPAQSATEAVAYTIGLNWYLNKNVRTAANFVHTDFKGGASNPVGRNNENAILTRLQMAF